MLERLIRLTWNVSVRSDVYRGFESLSFLMLWLYKQLCSNGRHWVICPVDHGHHFWLTDEEITNWRACPHCLGWWIL